ncbi:hypothetical protein Goarm_000842 [Gossypium armourianum]|uniref:Uncharacterized protein n=1 Tax=Gossypium armourianum TaxID=34283 RepID=A0A7J9KB71_9ROSI|nr:hypothetical protein [Gossypium armourianum]
MVGPSPPAAPWFHSSQPNAQWCSPGWCFPTHPLSIWSNPFVGSSPPQVSMPPPGTAQPQAYVPTPETVADNSWYPDFGATHHLTNSATSLGDSGSYKGPGKVFVGNGSALPILSTG